MKRFLVPITIFGLVSAVLVVGIFFFVPPVNGIIVAVFLTLVGLSLAAWGSLALYYLRRIWGPKDSPRYLLRQALKQGFFFSVAVVGFLLLQLFGATSPVTLALLVGLILLMERLS